MRWGIVSVGRTLAMQCSIVNALRWGKAEARPPLTQWRIFLVRLEMRDHELRSVLNDELHGRPGLPVVAPSRITHLAFTLAEGDCCVTRLA